MSDMNYDEKKLDTWWKNNAERCIAMWNNSPDRDIIAQDYCVDNNGNIIEEMLEDFYDCTAKRQCLLLLHNKGIEWWEVKLNETTQI